MSKAARSLTRMGAIALLLVLPVPTVADIAPEAGHLVHVQPVSGSCWASSISDCHEIVRSTPQGGEVEFILFFMTGTCASAGEELCLESLHSVLTWPPAWQCIAFEPCAVTGSLDTGGTTHALDLSWGGFGWSYPIGAAQGDIVPVARLVMNVVGPGRLGFARMGHAVLRHGCFGSAFVTYPAQVYAEAGMECGHVSPHCGYWDDECAARFWVEELRLSAPSGGARDSTVRYSAVGPWYSCPVTIDTHAPWCTAWAESVAFEESYLHVTADAAGLTPGIHATAIELAAGGTVSRCLPVTFVVEEATVTSRASWGRVKALYR